MANLLLGTELHDLIAQGSLLQGAILDEALRANRIKIDEFDPDSLRELCNIACRRKMHVSGGKRIANSASFGYFVTLGLKKKWLAKNILRAMTRSLVDEGIRKFRRGRRPAAA